MSRLLCCLCDMGAALSHPQEGEACDAGLAVAPPTMADVIRERKKKAGGAGLGTLRRRLAAAARRPRDARPDRGCEHARFIRSLVSSWRLAEVFVVCEQLEAGAALRDLSTQAELAREPAPALRTDLAAALAHRWWCDVELVGAGFSLPAHRAILSARSTYFRDLLIRYPSGTWRVPLEGAGGSLSRSELEACLLALYGGLSACLAAPPAHTHMCPQWERGSDANLDIISVENTGTWRSSRSAGGGSQCGCGRGRDTAAMMRRLAHTLGFTADALHTDMRYLLDSGEYADSRLVFRLEGGCGAAYGFRSALELPCHRLVLAARSRFFRSVMSRRSNSGSASANNSSSVCVDEKVLPRRFARALLHAAYTDQVDLSLVGRNSTSPSATSSASTNGTTGWSGISRGGSRPPTTAMLDDAFQLYEIARFLEMPIVVQGCEDCIVEALSADTLPHVLRWASAHHASQWVHRQAMRYLIDEFPSIMASSASARLPRSALASALASPFLQASEAQALRALLRWGALKHQLREPAAAWQPTAAGVSAAVTSVSRVRGARRRELGDAALRAQLGDLLALLRLEHLPPATELLQQAIRRGIIDAPTVTDESQLVDAWLGRGPYRAPRCFLPYLDELKALLEQQAAPDAELARVRRARAVIHPIPDTLYMVAAAQSAPDEAGSVGGGAGGAGGGGGGEGAAGAELACVSPRLAGALRARYRELCAAPPALRARLLHRHHSDVARVHAQIALRAVREMSLPDSCAELLLAADSDSDHRDNDNSDREREREGSSDNEWERAREQCCDPDECCNSPAKPLPSLHIPIDPTRPGTCRRELPSRPDAAQHRSWRTEYREPRWRESSGSRSGRLSAAVPDVAMAPNANTHLLTARDYCRPPPPALLPDYGPGAVLQLDLGDGATHTPRPGSRALRAAHSAERRPRGHAQAAQLHTGNTTQGGPRGDGAELRAALELSVVRAYSSLLAESGARRASLRPEPAPHAHVSVRTRASPSPSNTGASGSGSGSGGGGGSGSNPHLAEMAPAVRRRLDDGRERAAAAAAPGGGSGSSGSPSGSPRRHRLDLYRHDYRVEAHYGGGGAASRNHSPSNYA